MDADRPGTDQALALEQVHGFGVLSDLPFWYLELCFRS